MLNERIISIIFRIKGLSQIVISKARIDLLAILRDGIIR